MYEYSCKTVIYKFDHLPLNCPYKHIYITVKILCNKDVMAPSCSLCPITDDVNGNSWCQGACYFDTVHGTCKERSKLEMNGANFKWRIIIMIFLSKSYNVIINVGFRGLCNGSKHRMYRK